MNWFKKKLNRFFTEDIEEFEDEVELEEHEVVQETTREPETDKRRSFRFPIIADDEINELKPEWNPNHHEQRAYHTVYNNQVQQPSRTVYDVEASGIRELLEQRRNGKGKSVRKHHIENKLPLKQKTVPIEREKSSKQPKNIEKPEVEQVVRRRFVPTQVPSPVHGFKKPSPINELLDQKNEQKQQLVPNEETKAQVSNNPIEEVFIATQEVASTVIEKELNIKNEPLVTTQEDLLKDHSLPMNVNVDSHSQLAVQQLADDELSLNDEIHSEEETVEEESPYLESIDYDDDEENFDHELEDTFDEFNDDFEGSSNEDDENIVESIEDIVGGDEFADQLEDAAEEDIELEEVDITEMDEVFEDVETEDYFEEHVVEADDAPYDDFTSAMQKNDENINDISTEEISSPPVNTVDEKQIIHNEGHENNKLTSGSKLPFNVLMLKSDKEKLKMKESFQKISAQEVVESTKNKQLTDITPKMEVEKLPEETIVEDATPDDLAYEKPTFDFLIPPEEKTEDREWMESQAANLVESLSHFQVTAQVESIVQGPAVTQFEITVGHGTKVSKIKNLSDDLKLALAAKDIRIQAPIPGKSSIGIEIPNRISRAVRLSEVTRSESFIQSESPMEAALGLDLTGRPITIDLTKMPHGLIAGSTGSGKSVCINSILVSLLYKADPHELKLMLIDPKVVELAPFNNIPHLVSPVITDVKTATAALKWAVEEMERRYQLFAHVGVRDLSRYNKQADKNGNKNKLPYILIVIDELADLMMMAPSDVEESIARIAQKARACGIHLIVATQRPSVDVITGLIKSNIPTRIAFAVSSQIDSRTILDGQGAERLLGRGDMLYLGNGMSAPIRIQGTFVTDDEIEEIIDHVRSQGSPNYLFEHEELLKKTEMVEEYDELFEEVCRFVYEQGSASTSSIQRNYGIGYNRAARMMDLLEKNGFISEQRGSKPREVFITESDISSMFE